MTVAVWRIATEAPNYPADDLSGAGAKVTGGRWNRRGTPALYCASTIALACLETVVHIRAAGLPLNRYLVRLDVPDNVWQAATVFTNISAPIGWDAIPPGMTSLDTGEKWIYNAATALLLVPSVIVPEETNVLINPAHPDAAGIRAQKVRRWTYDQRMG
ncbi:hypothetical protein WQE_39879 [Paraburkholderia hospita]|uniref:RES domain-containing protein n=1 Tax=Paraburkholderia hospita TaxID=169430 RepID=A0ABP2PBU2_9BURK|nr:RES family NAD+ phosphorylase [Paraburkholderia hospita]EIM95291.1 hypothetical protein WQE_39879 [Paraburkholderia hospita]OUL84660.1 hypothetical protein CA602_19290 [Paraburkholderia hospita]SKD06507.1 RES domain-containing protein [Paraburkholderia hospita]